MQGLLKSRIKKTAWKYHLAFETLIKTDWENMLIRLSKPQKRLQRWKLCFLWFSASLPHEFLTKSITAPKMIDSL